MNRYFVINADDENMNAINNVIVGRPDRLSKSIDKTKILIKLHKNDSSDYDFLNKYQEQSRQEIIELLKTNEWTRPIF